jgi:hypothetical protein
MIGRGHPASARADDKDLLAFIFIVTDRFLRHDGSGGGRASALDVLAEGSAVHQQDILLRSKTLSSGEKAGTRPAFDYM